MIINKVRYTALTCSFRALNNTRRQISRNYCALNNSFTSLFTSVILSKAKLPTSPYKGIAKASRAWDCMQGRVTSYYWLSPAALHRRNTSLIRYRWWRCSRARHLYRLLALISFPFSYHKITRIAGYKGLMSLSTSHHFGCVRARSYDADFDYADIQTFSDCFARHDCIFLGSCNTRIECRATSIYHIELHIFGNLWMKTRISLSRFRGWLLMIFIWNYDAYARIRRLRYCS